jgi:hypothetical protein
MSRESWLDSESERWQHDGLITEDTRRAILARYPKPPADPSRALIPLAVLTAGFGVMLFVAWHWRDLSAAMKLSLTTALMLCLYGGAAWSANRRRTVATELWLLAAPLGAFTLIAALAEVYVWNDPSSVTLWCAVAAAVTAAATGATLVTALAAATLLWWTIVSGGGTLPWPFLLVFPLVAFAAEQSRHRAVATLTAVAFGAFAMIMAANTWNSVLPPMLFIALAGAAIEQWSQQPPARRPVFARATPGSAIAILGLIVTLLGIVHANPNAPAATSLFATHAALSPWPALALAIGLIVVGFGTSRDAALRPRVVAVAIALWLNAAAAGRVTLFSDGVWVALFSAVLLFVGASLVREGAAAGDSGKFVAGLTAVLGLVAIHFSSGEALRGSAVLLVSAAVLFIVGRRSRKSAAATETTS